MKKSFLRTAVFVVLALSVPLLLMQLGDDVDWGIIDFVAMGVLLFAAGIGIEYTRKKVTNPLHRTLICVGIAVVFLLVWAELAVDIAGAPLDGS